MDATIAAAPAANIPATYTSGRTDQSKTAGGDFKSALADTAPDRNRGQSNADSSTTAAATDSDKTTAAPVAAVNGKASNTNSNAASDNASTSDLSEAGADVAQVLAEEASTATAAASSTKDVSTSLAKLVAALTQVAKTDAATSTTTTDAPATDTATPAKTPVKGTVTGDEQQVLSALVGAEQAATDAAPVVNGAKTGVKAPVLDKTKTSDTDEAPEATTKDTSVGVQDALSLLGQAVAAQVPTVTSQEATTTVTADHAATAAIGDKLATGPASKVKSDTTAKASDATASATTATAAAATRSSAADALHMVSGSSHDANAASEEKLAVADSASLNNSNALQGVDVLDSRRIIAPVDTNNGANIAATMAGDRDWSATMRSTASSDVSTSDKLTTDKTLNTLSIKMSPESLGSVTANLKLVDGQLTVSLVVENSNAYRKLHEDQGELMKSLKAQGFSIDQIQISIASPEKSSSDTSQNNSQNQTSGQQQAQQNSSGFNQGSGRQQTQPGFESFGQTSGGLVDEATPSGGLGSNNTPSGTAGQLYL